MFDPEDLPLALRCRAFTVAEAAEEGLSRRVLQGRHFRRIHRGVLVWTGLPLTLDVLVGADLRMLPPDACLSHTTGLRWLGFALDEPEQPHHYSTNTTRQTRLEGVILHRRKEPLRTMTVRGRAVLAPARLLVDAAAQLSPAGTVRAGDQLVRLGCTTPQEIAAFARTQRLDGVVQARRASGYVRERVDSVCETDVRLLLVMSGLPEPEVNRPVLDDRGMFVARPDLLYRQWWVAVEYDGRHHLTDAAQWAKDLHRRERLEAAGWTVIVVTAADMRTPSSVLGRVWAALVRAGYPGPPPHYVASARTTLRDV